MRTTVYLEGESEEAYKQAPMPRDVTLSAIVRWVLLAIVTPEKEFLRKRNASAEGIAVRDYLRKVRIDKLIL